MVLAVAGATFAYALGNPSAGFTFTPTQPQPGDTVQFTSHYTPDSGDTIDYAWNFDDGPNAISSAENPSHVYTTARVYTVSLVARELNPAGSTSTETTTSALITVAAPTVTETTNLPPTANPDAYSTQAGTPLVIDAAAGVLHNDTDPDGDSLTIDRVESDPAHGSLHLNPDGSFTYTPNEGFVGTDTFEYIATDGTHTSNVADVTIQVTGAIARDDSYSTPFDTALDVQTVERGVLGNDSIAGQASATVVGGPAHGGLDLHQNGTFVYTPTQGYSGSDSFTYAVTDGEIRLATATVAITVIRPPDNDNLANATPISGLNGSASGTNAGATIENGEPANPAGGHSIWFKWRAPTTGADLITTGGGLSTLLAVYEGPASGATFAGLVPAATNANINGAGRSAVSFDAISGRTYYIAVDGDAGATGAVALSWTELAASGAVSFLPGCDHNTLARNDDGSTASVPIGFQLDFFGFTTSSLYVNNNGNVTFDSQMSTYTPFALTTTAMRIIAPYFGDVDTRGTASGLVHYGSTSYQGHDAFCVLWTDVGYGKGVGYYSGGTDRLNSFQLLLVARPDTGVDNFDIVFNYDNVQWEAGGASGGSGGLGGSSARAGYSNGVDQSLELPGSAVNGALLDSSPAGLIHSSRNSAQPGRYVFAVRNGGAPTGHQIAGRVLNGTNDGLAGASVYVCGGSGCTNTTTTSAGDYVVSGLAPGDYTVRAFAAADSKLLPAERSVAVGQVDQDGVDVTLGLSLNARLLTVTGCSHANASYSVSRGSHVLASRPMAESSPGVYTANVDEVSPVHGSVRVGTTLICPSAGEVPPVTETQNVDVFADPSGTVVDAGGSPVEGATVTILRRNEDTGVFEAVTAGSAFLSPATADNPETTGADGAFGWDVAPGEYRLQAVKDGCGSAQSGDLTVKPTENPTGLVLRLPCAATSPPPPEPPVLAPPSFPPPPPPPEPPLPPPVKDRLVDVAPAVGTVLVNGLPLQAGQQIPFGSIIDTTNGIVQLTSVGPDGPIQTALFFGGAFAVVQALDGVTELDMVQGDFGVCANPKRTMAGNPTKPPARSKKTTVRSVWGQGKGKFRTKGRYAAATVRGTRWYTADRCDGTYTKVDEGVVNVLDLVRNRTLIVSAGESVLVPPPAPSETPDALSCPRDVVAGSPGAGVERSCTHSSSPLPSFALWSPLILDVGRGYLERGFGGPH